MHGAKVLALSECLISVVNLNTCHTDRSNQARIKSTGILEACKVEVPCCRASAACSRHTLAHRSSDRFPPVYRYMSDRSNRGFPAKNRWTVRTLGSHLRCLKMKLILSSSVWPEVARLFIYSLFLNSVSVDFLFLIKKTYSFADQSRLRPKFSESKEHITGRHSSTYRILRNEPNQCVQPIFQPLGPALQEGPRTRVLLRICVIHKKVSYHEGGFFAWYIYKQIAGRCCCCHAVVMCP